MLSGFLGDNQKLGFRSRPDGIARLWNVPISETDPFWTQFVNLFDSASDVYSLILPNDIRRALKEIPDNVAILIKFTIEKLCDISTSPSFPAAPLPTVTSLTSALMGSSSSQSTNKQLLNCIRVLQRVLPVVFEVDSGLTRFEMDILWRRPLAANAPRTADEGPQFVIADEDEEEEEVSRPGTPKRSSQDLGPSLAERLLSTLVDLLFCCGFTLPSKEYSKIAYLIWDKGIGSNNAVTSTNYHDGNKIEVLRLLLILLSRPMYTNPSALLTSPSFYSLQFVQKTPRRHILAVLCSLINVSYRRESRISLATMKEKLPYNHLVFKVQDPKHHLVSLCLQVLCAVLDFQSGSARDRATVASDTALPTARTNAFRHFIAKLHRDQDLNFLLEGIYGILEVHTSTNAVDSLLPGSKKGVSHVTENIFFLWKVLELNRRLRSLITEKSIGTSIIGLLMCICHDHKGKNDHGISRTISYILQLLSTEPSFQSSLSRPSKEINLPAKWGTYPTFGEGLLMHILSLSTQPDTIVGYPAFLISLVNIAPHLKDLSSTATSRLIHMLTSLSSPRFLLSEEGAPRSLFFILESINSLLQHNSARNPALVAAILEAQSTFAFLQSFTLEEGLRHIARSAENEQDPRRLSGPRRRSGVSLQDQIVSSSPSSSSHELGLTGESSLHKGKDPYRRIDDHENMTLLASQVGKNGFIPTVEWVSSWQPRLPLDLITIVISELRPYYDEMQRSASASSSSKGPALPSIEHLVSSSDDSTCRPFQMSEPVQVWASSTIWGEICTHNLVPLGLWNGTSIRLFHLKSAPQSHILADAYGAVGGLLSRN